MHRSALMLRLPAIAALSAALFWPAAATADAEPSGPLATGRFRHVTAPLPDGRALVAGGYILGGDATATAEIFDSNTNTFTPTGALATGRGNAGAATLMDWRVLVVGGLSVGQIPAQPIASAEIFDVSTGTWSATAAMGAARESPVALRLPSGLVLVIAGDSTQASCELFDPATGSFTPTGSLTTPRVRFAAAVLDDGRVLVAGGAPSTDVAALSSAEIWDPATGLWTSTGSMATARAGATATTLFNGKVLIVAGRTSNSYNSAVASTELYDPAAGTFAPAGSLATARSAHTAAASIFDGSVIVAGGVTPELVMTPSIERYSAAGTWQTRGSMVDARWLHTMVALNNGEILISGGYASSVIASSEIVDWQCVANNPTVSPNWGFGVAHPGSVIPSNITVTHPAGCIWRVTNTASWITMITGATGFGNGTVSFNVASNSNSTTGRTTQILVGGVAVGVAQSGNECANATITPSSQSLGSSGGSFTLSLSAVSSCLWTVSAFPQPWIQITPPGGIYSTFGSATFTVTVSANGGVARNANVSIATRPLAISQAGNACIPAPTISPSSRAYTAAGGGNTVAVTAPSACTWTVTGKPTWITMPISGTGSATLTLTAAANWGAERSAMFTIAGNSFTGTQEANACASATLAPISASHSASAETGTIALTAASNCAWSVTGLPPWMTVTSGTSGTGSATIAYAIAMNSGVARNAIVGVADRTFAVSQAAGACFPAPTLSSSGRSFTATAGNGTPTVVTVTAPSACAWSVSNIPTWVTVTSGASGSGNGTIAYAVDANFGAARSATLVLAGASHSVTQSAPGIANQPTARMSLTRVHHSTLTLADGRVMVAGGMSGPTGSEAATSSVEIYDPGTGTFSAGPPLTQARGQHLTVKLADGRLLVAGGRVDFTSPTTPLASSEIYDPVAATWTPTGSMVTARLLGAAVRLADGRVLVTGGWGSGDVLLTSSEIFDPATGLFTAAGATLGVRKYPAIAALADGRVLLAGGKNTAGSMLATTELWNPATGNWTAGPSMTYARGDGPAAATLPDGRVLVAGGTGAGTVTELFDPATGLFTQTGSMNYWRSYSYTVQLDDGTVYSMGANTLSVERYGAATGTWQVVAGLSDARAWGGAALAGGGKILLTGGYWSGSGALSSAEIVDLTVCPAPAGLAPASQSLGDLPASGSVSVTLPSACPRTASSAASWITLTGGASGNGSGTVSYSVAGNTGAARTGTFSVAGAVFTVSQAAGPPATFCSSRSSTSSYEWIQQVTVAGQVRSTGNNGGYSNQTGSGAIALARGSNAVTLNPGFSGGSYTEYWRIWIDFNGDSVFSDSEIVYTGSSTGAIGASITVPAGAAAGSRRMRISMKYSAAPTSCEIFSYGEVEDYTVTY